MAAVHDRYLGYQPTSRRPMREVYHSSQCAVLFSKWLSQPIGEEDKDAIWATAVTLANLTFSSINVSSFAQAWPLKPSDSSDLQWLRLKANDKALWHLADPTRPSSVFRAVSDTFSDFHQPLPTRGMGDVPIELAQLCGLDNLSTPKNNPYFGFVHALSKLLEMPKGEASLGRIFWAVSVIPNVLCTRLEEKDPVALLLLYLWYTKARECRWWVDLRARYEIPAIRTYLQRHYSDIGTIQALLVKEFR
ncbi:MAG: hypothetical protein M4579_007192 [Chaenotheca gracillima]|nr:MAG: hypothetical protein M4579_007192 [Chaenotheca gracillima]